MNTLPGLALASTLVLSLAAAGFAPPAQDPAAMEALLEQARPGAEHGRLAALAGDWDVALFPVGSDKPVNGGRGVARVLMGGRFLDVDFTIGEGEAPRPLRYTLGFDRRHGEFSLILIDDTGTYAVTARGPESAGLIRMNGVDDDPYMASLGYEKKYAFELSLEGKDEFAVALHFIDTREEPEVSHLAYTYRFTRR